MTQNIALLLCLDSNKNHKYEYECLQCIKCWRNVCHELKDIDIYVYINKLNKISSYTFEQLKQYKNIYFKFYEFESKYICLNTLYCQYLFEKYQTKYNKFIYLDLDMFLINSIPIQLLECEKNVFCTYNINNIKLFKDDKELQYRIIKLANKKPFITFFNIINIKYNIFDKLYNLINSNKYLKYFNDNILYNFTGDYYYEEGIYDYAYINNIINDTNSELIDIKLSVINKIFIHKHIDSFKDFLMTGYLHDN